MLIEMTGRASELITCIHSLHPPKNNDNNNKKQQQQTNNNNKKHDKRVDELKDCFLSQVQDKTS